MRLIDQELKPVAFLDVDEFGKRRPVAEHRIDPFEHQEPASLLAFEPVEALGQIIGVVVPEPDELCSRQCASVIDR